MKAKIINTLKAPKALGPYSQAIKAGDLIFCSGQLGIDSKTNELVEGIEGQTQKALENLSNILAQQNLSLKDVVRVDIFIKNINNFSKVNEVYEKTELNLSKPARQTVEVSNLPKGALIEISCIAYQGESDE